jgi:predicted HAD superfamily Cof-like phosphohydrolase
MSPYMMVEEFHKKFGVPIGAEVTEELLLLRDKLIQEEAWEVQGELIETVKLKDLSKVEKDKLTKELADLMYVTIGTAVTFGLPLEQVFAEVHRSNMSKLGADGKPVYREDGKVLKGPNYTEPNLERFF